MTLKKESFRMYGSEEEIAARKKKSWPISVRVNAEEQQIINELKKMLNVHMEGTALKIGARIARNVLHSTFGPEILRYLTDPNRGRPEQEEEIKPA